MEITEQSEKLMISLDPENNIRIDDHILELNKKNDRKISKEQWVLEALKDSLKEADKEPFKEEEWSVEDIIKYLMGAPEENGLHRPLRTSLKKSLKND